MKIIQFLGIAFLLLSYSCEGFYMDKWYAIYIKNNSQITVMATAGYARYGMHPYPDTILPVGKPFLQRILPNKTSKLISSGNWEKIINDMPLDTLSIYIFDADTINFYDWSRIKEEYKVLKRYDLSLDDLKRLNWKITYP